MPKDATKNVDRYKIGGGHLNEYEFEQEKAADRKQRSTGKQPRNAASKESRQSAARKESLPRNATKKISTTSVTKKSAKKK